MSDDAQPRTRPGWACYDPKAGTVQIRVSEAAARHDVDATPGAYLARAAITHELDGSVTIALTPVGGDW